MEPTKIRRLIDKAQQGDKAALNELVEWGMRETLEQELISAPAGLRAEALAGLDALHKARQVKANRTDSMDKTNDERDAPKHAVVEEALTMVALYDQPLPKIRKAVLDYIKKNGLCKKHKLKEPPCRRFVDKKIQAKLAETLPTLL